jgi:hypothetical protein
MLLGIKCKPCEIAFHKISSISSHLRGSPVRQNLASSSANLYLAAPSGALRNYRYS